MSKIRKLLIVLLAIAATLCMGIALVACDDGPGFKNPDEGKESYIITVQSQGGLRLNDVEISAVKDGEVKAKGLTINGRVELKLEPDEYVLQIGADTVPAGYGIPATTFKTSAANKSVAITLRSKVITKEAPASTRYKIGDVMYDFEMSDIVTGETYKLSKLINDSEKKAVMINFFGTQCGPCMSEFPVINKVYKDYRDNIEIFAIANYSIPDTQASLVKFKETSEIAFPVSLDTPALKSLFRMGETVNNITRGWPTTVIIDRYGAIAEIATGANTVESEWKATFNKYISDDYTQDGINNGSEGSDNTIVYTPRPDGYTTPDSSAIKDAIGDADGRITNYGYDLTAAGEENTWPWQLGGEGNDRYLTASNASAAASYAFINVDIQLKPLEGIEFEYNINTRSEKNSLGVVMDGKQYFRATNSSDGWKTARLTNPRDDSLYYSTSTRTVQLSFTYLKNAEVDGDTPVSIRNIRIYNAAEASGIKDFAISVVDGKKPDATNSYHLNITKDESNGLYYYNYTDNGVQKKSLLFVNLNDITPWTEIHYGKTYFTSPEEGSSTVYASSLYYFSYWYMSNWNTKGEDEYLKIDYDDTDVIMFGYSLQNFSDNGYLPVNEKLKTQLINFTKAAYNVKDEFKDKFSLTDRWYDEQWLELCYYFTHIGAEHAKGEKCWEKDIPVEGLSFDYAIETQLGKTEVNVTKILNLWAGDNVVEAGGGVKYKFTPDRDGVYCFYSTHTAIDADPKFIIVDPLRQHVLAENDSDPRYDRVFDGNGDALIYIELKAGQTYYITAAMHTANELGEFTMHIEHIGEYYETILVATAGEGYWTWKEDANGMPVTDANGNIIFYYIAQSVALNPQDNVYYLKNGDDYGSPMYIDFVHQTYFDEKGRSLKQLLDGNAFSSYLTEEETAKLQEYCDKALAQDETAQLYGLWEAERDLVALLNKCLDSTTTTNDWQQAACYIAQYGTPQN